MPAPQGAAQLGEEGAMGTEAAGRTGGDAGGGPLPTVSLTLGTVTRVEPPWVRYFYRNTDEWRRVFSEAFGTFFLVLVAAGAGVVAAAYPGTVTHPEAVVAPALMVLALILSTGAVSGAHLNPIVSVAFALRAEFPWRRVPLYLVAQIAGAVGASLVLWALFGKVGGLGATNPGAGVGDVRAMGVEVLLSCGLVTTILGTASGAQNVGALSAIAVSGYIALAGMWASPVSGASMNPVRSLGPALVSGHLGDYWVYVAGPFLGAGAAVLVAIVLRGRGRDLAAARAAQGALGEIVLGSGRHETIHDLSAEASPEP